MANKGKVFSVIGLILFLSGGSYFLLNKEFLPIEDRNAVFTIVSAAEGASLDYTDKAIQQAESVFAKTPEVKQYFSAIALSSAGGVGQVNSGIMFTTLHPKEERARSQQAVVQSLFPQMMGIPQAFVFPINPPSRVGGGGFGKSVYLVIQGFDIEALDRVSQKILERALKIPGFINVESDLKLNKPQLDVQINREKASVLGVSVRDITTTLQILLGGLDLSDFQMNSKRYDVMVQMVPENRLVPEQLSQLYVKGRQNTLVPLSSVIDTEENVTPKSLNHFGRLRSATISGSVLPIPGITMGTVMKALEEIIQDELPAQMRYAWSGQSREFLTAQTSTTFFFILAVVVVFLILSAQFESFIHPFIVMMTVPLAVCGALLTLFIWGTSLNIYSQIGIILLIGLVTKNGILIVEYANQQKRQDPTLTAEQAAIQGAGVRFRPILMTSIATIFGAVPIAFGLGAGAESRQPLGLAIVGGMMMATFLSLFVIPMVYQLMNKRLDSGLAD